MSKPRVFLVVALVLCLGALMFSCSDDATQQNKSPVASDTPSQTRTGEAAIQMAPGGNLSGAIFTTTPDGGIVNENVRYESKLEVYLDGGPGNNAPQHAAGLPDGWYVFQVTDPPGKVLLSEDPSKCRVLEIENDIIVRLVEPSEFGLSCDYTVGKGNNEVTYPCHIQDDPDGAAGASGRHDTNTDVDHGADGAKVVQLMPFLDTPNPGGVYKAWLTPFDAYLAMGGDLEALPVEKKVKGKVVGFEADPGFGPPRNMVKTDNFKVKERPPMIYIYKYEDTNGNGVQDPGEPEITGWKIYITETLHDGSTVTNVAYTPVCKAIDHGTTVRIEEDLPEGWGLSYVLLDGVPVSNPSTVIDVSFGPTQMDREVTFGNYEEIPKSGAKWHDLDADGKKESGEPYLEGWKITINGTDGKGEAYYDEALTDAEGKYDFLVPPGSYTVSEVCETGWYQSYPVPTDGCGSGVYNVVFLSGDVDEGNDFGNYKPCQITVKKYWDKNKNDQKDADEPYLAGFEFCLYDAAGNLVSANDFVSTPDPACLVTDDSGVVSWDNLLPGTYTIKETPKDGWVATGDTEKTLTCKSGDDLVRKFGNVPCVELRIKKFHDKNINGYPDTGEEYVTGWKVFVTSPSGVTTQYTTPVSINTCEAGVWTITEDTPEGTVQTVALLDGVAVSSYPNADPDVTVTVDASSAGEVKEIVYGNVGLGELLICKVYDADGDAVADPGELKLVGWQVVLTGTTVNGEIVGPITDYTGDDGCVTFGDLLPGTYTVEEELPPLGGYEATGPTSKTFVITSKLSGPSMSAGQASFDFTNICVDYVDFDTKGYWHNKNGLSEMTQADIDYANGLDPYSSESSYFDAGDEPFDGYFSDGTPVEAPLDAGGELVEAGTPKAEVSLFLVDTNATGDPREQLAQQLLAIIFNTRHRLADPDDVIELPDGSTAMASALIAEAIAVWNSGSHDERVQMQELLNALNNDGSIRVIFSTPCKFRY